MYSRCVHTFDGKKFGDGYTEMIGNKWQPNSKKFKCKICNKFHLIDIHNNGKQSIPVRGRNNE